jgi:hypothetical protein
MGSNGGGFSAAPWNGWWTGLGWIHYARASLESNKDPWEFFANDAWQAWSVRSFYEASYQVSRVTIWHFSCLLLYSNDLQICRNRGRAHLRDFVNPSSQSMKIISSRQEPRHCSGSFGFHVYPIRNLWVWYKREIYLWDLIRRSQH